MVAVNGTLALIGFTPFRAPGDALLTTSRRRVHRQHRVVPRKFKQEALRCGRRVGSALQAALLVAIRTTGAKDYDLGLDNWCERFT